MEDFTRSDPKGTALAAQQKTTNRKTRKQRKNNKPAPLTAAQLKEKHEANAAEFAEKRVWFKEKCDIWRPLWDDEVAAELAKNDGRTREQIEQYFADNAKSEVTGLNEEIKSQIARTGMILSATSFLFAVFALRNTASKSAWATAGIVFLAISLFLAAIAFVTALVPLRPPLRRAWKDKFHKRAFQTLLVHDPFTSWVMDCWLGDRRTPVVQLYKKVHSVVVPLLIGAAIFMVPGLCLSLIFK